MNAEHQIRVLQTELAILKRRVDVLESQHQTYGPVTKYQDFKDIDFNDSQNCKNVSYIM